KGFRELETDKGPVFIGGIAALRHLKNVEAELSPDVREGVVPISHDCPKSRPEIRIKDRHSRIDAKAVTADVGRVVRERAKREGVLIDVLSFLNQRHDKIAGADVVSQIAE